MSLWTSKTTTTTYSPISQPKRQQIHIYTDGSCLGDPTSQDPRPGGYAWIEVEPMNGYADINDQEHTEPVISGSEGFLSSTNNRMEMMAIINALNTESKIHEDENVEFTIHTDSQLVVNAFAQGWIENWERNGYKTANKKPVENQDLWQELKGAMANAKNVHLIWVKGHAKDRWNEWCDQTAKAAAADPKHQDVNYERGSMQTDHMTVTDIQTPGPAPEAQTKPQDARKQSALDALNLGIEDLNTAQMTSPALVIPLDGNLEDTLAQLDRVKDILEQAKDTSSEPSL